MAKKIYVSVGIDVDAVAGWLGSYGGEDSPDDISRGLFAGEVGVPRLLGPRARSARASSSAVSADDRLERYAWRHPPWQVHRPAYTTSVGCRRPAGVELEQLLT